MNDRANLSELVAQAQSLADVEAAPGVARLSVDPVNDAGTRALYVKRVKVHPRQAKGLFRNLKWGFMALSLAIYYALPWLRWDRGPNLPDQAVLIDFPGRRFYILFLDFLPQELYYVTGILVAASLALFLVTALFGRVWCGYACPQTVWTDLMIAVEQFFEGDRNERIRLDKQPWTASKIARRTATNVVWLLIALMTGGTLVFYFADAPTLARELVRGEAPLVAYAFIGIFTATTFVLGGYAREQVCTYMCPWPRIQGAMFDRDSLTVTYREWRGEPRGPKKKTETWDNRGDCIDCKLCVAVCPAGIDIRNGPQLECIQCALCVDACNTVMDKIGRPRNLIAYDTFVNLDAAARGGRAPLRLVRPRTLFYAGLLALVCALMVGGWMLRRAFDVGVVRDANPNYVRLADGSTRNGYTLKLLNKRGEPLRVRVAVESLPGARLVVAGDPDATFTIAPNETEAPHVFVMVAPEDVDRLSGADAPIVFSVTDLASGAVVRHRSVFRFERRS